MEPEILRNELHKIIDQASEDRLIQIYIEIIESDDKPFELSGADWTMMEERREEYLQGNGKSYTWDEVKDIVLSKLKK